MPHHSRNTSPRIKVTGSSRWAILAIGLLTGVALALGGLSPTGSAPTDWFVLLVVATGAVWMMASAPWWALSGLAGIAAALARPLTPVLIGVGVFGLSLAIGALRRSQPVERAVVGGGSILVLSMARELHRFGWNTVVAVTLVAVVMVLSLTRRSRRERKWAFATLGVIGTILAVGLVGLMISAVSARPDLSEGNRVARQGLQQLKQGEFDAAQASFARAADTFARADGDLGSPLAQAARLVPVVSQNRNAGAGLASAALATTREIDQQLQLIDFDRLRIVDGRIDIGAIRDLRDPMQRLQVALDELEQGVVEARSPWLLSRVTEELDQLAVEIDDQQALGLKAIEALEVAPAILGSEGERVYFVMFTTPAEARGQGGFMGNYAEVTIDDGGIELTAFGRHNELSNGGPRPRILEDAPADWLDRYAEAGFRMGPEGLVAGDAWTAITVSPNFPSTGQVVSELYAKSGGREIDGVFSLDVFALEQLIGLVGPVDAPNTPEPLTGTNAADFLLMGQYEFEPGSNDQRVDALETVAEETIDRLLSTNPPDPIALGRAMAPMVGERRLLGWLANTDEQRVLSEVNMDGGLLDDLDGRDGFAVIVNNVGSNKLDTYLGRSMVYETTSDGDRLSVTITNEAPIDELPPYAVGTTVGLPTGWSRLAVTINTNRPVSNAELEGEPVDLTLATEGGLLAYTLFIEIEPGSSHEVTLDFESKAIRSAAEIVIQPQPLVIPEIWQIGGRDPTEVRRTRTFAP